MGCGLVWARSTWVAERRLERPIVTQVTGEVRSVDHLASKKATRLLVVPTDRALPPLVRVSIDDEDMPGGVAPRTQIDLRARLAPPPAMALPGTYDFSRDA
jgi:competence protein ComEC